MTTSSVMFMNKRSGCNALDLHTQAPPVTYGFLDSIPNDDLN